MRSGDEADKEEEGREERRRRLASGFDESNVCRVVSVRRLRSLRSSVVGQASEASGCVLVLRVPPALRHGSVGAVRHNLEPWNLARRATRRRGERSARCLGRCSGPKTEQEGGAKKGRAYKYL